MAKIKLTSYDEYKKQHPISQERQDSIDAQVKEATINIQNFNMNIARAVQEHKEKNHLTFEDLKSALGTSMSQTQRIINGTAGFTTETIFKVGHMIGKSPKIVWE